MNINDWYLFNIEKPSVELAIVNGDAFTRLDI